MHAQFKGVPAIVLATKKLRVAVIPGQGAHIASLYDLETGHEMLWQPGGDTYRLSRPGEPFEEGECAGIDDMFPCAAACKLAEGFYAGTRLPDHGETWTLPCETAAQGEDAASFTMWGECLPYTLTKSISLQGSALRVGYRAVNTGSRAFPFLWAAHPLFRAEDYSAILAPGLRGEVGLPFCFGKEKASGRLRYPADCWDDGTPADLTRIPPKEAGIGYKFMSGAPVFQGRCLLVGAPGKKSLEVEFPADKVPFLGVWVDACSNGKAPAYVVAPEPSTHYSVDLNDDLLSKANVLQAGASFEWWIQYTLKT